MGFLSDQKPVKLITSIIFKEERSLLLAEEKLKRAFGPLEPLSKILEFDYTDYYFDELGSPLKRRFLCFKKLISKEKLYRIKLATNRIEDTSRREGKRTVNIDPGYITEAKLVLLTTKDYTHRVYMGGRIFAESTLFFQDGSFKPWPWTYPDYASEESTSYFEQVRGIYLQNLKVKIKNVKPKLKT